jgi:PEP-CTERM motif
LALAAAAPAAASATTFVDRAAFNVGVSGVVNNDLNALPIGPVTTVFGVETIASGSSAAGALSSYGGAFGTALSGLSTFDSIVINFTAPIYAFAFDDLDLTGGNSEYANIVVTLVGGAVETFSVSELDSDFQTAAFFGYASSTALQSVSIWSSDAPGGVVGARANLIDNLAISRVAQGAVPEPGTWAMMFAGFGMIGAAMRRRRVNATTAQLA